LTLFDSIMYSKRERSSPFIFNAVWLRSPSTLQYPRRRRGRGLTYSYARDGSRTRPQLATDLSIWITTRCQVLVSRERAGRRLLRVKRFNSFVLKGPERPFVDGSKDVTTDLLDMTFKNRTGKCLYLA
jgi:hypothetical protein